MKERKERGEKGLRVILIMDDTPRGLYTFQALFVLPGDPGNELRRSENLTHPTPRGIFGLMNLGLRLVCTGAN